MRGPWQWAYECHEADVPPRHASHGETIAENVSDATASHPAIATRATGSAATNRRWNSASDCGARDIPAQEDGQAAYEPEGNADE